MARPPSTDIRLKELRQEVRTCRDPFDLAADLAYENERLRRELKALANYQSIREMV